MIPENLLKNESFKEFRKFQQSLNFEGPHKKKERDDSKDSQKGKNYK